jgi:pyridoxal phosphate enzyme (YggS family)
MATIADNLQAVKSRIRAAAQAAGRAPESVRLLAVSKTHPAALLGQAAAAGQHAFGENYVQEALEKMRALPALEWHLVGPLQSNKTRQAAESFDWVHTVASEKIARRLSEQRQEVADARRGPLNVLVQVNISGEPTKAGVTTGELLALCEKIVPLEGVRLRGLMAIPEPTQDVALQRARFSEVRRLMESLGRQGVHLDTLSMGMSGDMEAAIAEGATMVRIGTAIFGARESVRKDDYYKKAAR